MAIELDLLKVMTQMNQTLDKFHNSVASAINAEKMKSVDEKIKGDKNSNKAKEKADKNVLDSVKKFNKATDTATKNINNRDRQSDKYIENMGKGFTGLLKRMGTSVTKEFPFAGNGGAIREGMDALNKNIANSSQTFQYAITKEFKKQMNALDLDTEKFRQNMSSLGGEFGIITGIMDKVSKSGEMSKKQYDNLQNAYKVLGEAGFDTTEMFSEATIALNKFTTSTASNDKVAQKQAKKALDARMKEVNATSDVFHKGADNFIKAIDKNLARPFENLKKKIDAFGGKLSIVMKAGMGVGLYKEQGAIGSMVQEGFGDDDLISKMTQAFSSGQSQEELFQTIKEFRNEFRFFGDSANALKVAGSDAFAQIKKNVQGQLHITGKENTQFIATQMQTFSSLGIRPTTENIIQLNEGMKRLGVITNKNVKGIQSMFNTLSKDKSFKSMFVSINKNGTGMDKLFKRFESLRKSTGMTIEEFGKYQKSLADARNKPALTRMVQGIFKGKLAERLGMGSEKAAVLRQGTENYDSLDDKGKADFDLFSTQQEILLEAQMNAFKKAGDTTSQIPLDIFSEKAGVTGNAELLAKQKSGEIDYIRKNIDALEIMAEKPTGWVGKFSASVENFISGIKGSPFGAIAGGIGGLFADMASGAIGFSLATKGVKTTIASIKGVIGNSLKAITGAGMSTVKGMLNISKSGLSVLGKVGGAVMKRIPLVAAIAGAGAKMLDRYNNSDGSGSDRGGIVGAGLDGALTAIPQGLASVFDWAAGKIGFETDVAGWFDGFTLFETIGESLGGIFETVGGWLGEGAGWVVDKTGKVVDWAGGLASDLTSTLGDASDYIAEGFSSGWDAVTSWFGDGEEEKIKKPNKISEKEQAILAEKGRDALQASLDKLSEHMSGMVEATKEGVEQADKQHTENKLLNDARLSIRANHYAKRAKASSNTTPATT